MTHRRNRIFESVLSDFDHAAVTTPIERAQNFLNPREEWDGARFPILGTTCSILAFRTTYVDGPRFEIDVGPLQRTDLTLPHRGK
jgi:hypothetical protein